MGDTLKLCALSGYEEMEPDGLTSKSHPWNDLKTDGPRTLFILSMWRWSLRAKQKDNRETIWRQMVPGQSRNISISMFAWNKKKHLTSLDKKNGQNISMRSRGVSLHVPSR